VSVSKTLLFSRFRASLLLSLLLEWVRSALVRSGQKTLLQHRQARHFPLSTCPLQCSYLEECYEQE